MTYSWQGASGRWYEFEVARARRDWQTAGGIYLFVKPHLRQNPHDLEWGGPIALYAARTHDFSAALARHDMWEAAQNLGAAEIHLLAIADEKRRAEVEKDILEAQTPILNRQMLRRVA